MTLEWALSYRYIWELSWGKHVDPEKLLPKTLYKVRTVDLLVRAVYSRYYVLLADSLVRACTPVGLLSSSNRWYLN